MIWQLITASVSYTAISLGEILSSQLDMRQVNCDNVIESWPGQPHRPLYTTQTSTDWDDVTHKYICHVMGPPAI